MGERGRRVLEGEQGIGKMVEGLADTIRDRERQENIVTAVVVGGRREIKSPGTMFAHDFR